MQPDERPNIALVTEDSFAALVFAFLGSPKFLGYSEETQKVWGRELRFAARPDCLGAISRAEIRPSLVQAFFDGLAGRPGKQAASLSAIKQLEKWAVVRDHLPRSITLGVETEDSDDDGHIPWNDDQVVLAEKYARPDLAKVVTLGANTGQRGSDLVRMLPTDVEVFDGLAGINVRQKKTKRIVWVPITSPLALAMEGWERLPGPFLRKPDGQPWTRKDLTKAWAYERDTNDKLRSLLRCGPEGNKALVLHGLRGHACVRLKRAGAGTNQIADMVGMSEEMVKNYTRFSSQQQNAAAAVNILERTLVERARGISDKGGW